ncbi:Serine/threonine-protein kinase PrkC,serine/threonine-protein kinase,Predicted ATPase,TOMM system kinase/cyclase fusion protein,Protein kinase domain [Chlamydia serpentis]|uniref:Serine/threonine-protein kinase PrkC,serine/threonine-protein kinase,Predicted ATPase,TOMM system kinase/cyclase fusion protein,Protein kinase domain n=1 Tax=Chlamydia serpentis TaxID=1967782 RepID=A0A2R8FBU6_9CHLA|nr:serine/threonine-protein kinase [Chlamydia serpentis]SPN73821.1 Serine/threonine-protein kinase PrkC,serine/threonine-protein kinase,Predicted ATPase,TOMM system kinase/cyclase fusion protein,Protein kinase domain [Chlamydia serpentis]
MDCRSDIPLPESQVIGGYHVKKILSKKLRSRVLQGLHPETRHTTVIKVFSPFDSFNSRAVHNFLKEAQSLHQIVHPNIVKFYRYGKWQDCLYLAMEYIEGVSLRDFILSQFISLPRAINIIFDIAQALEYLHNRDILHKDIKPENILITSQGKIKLIDFGLAAWDSEIYSSHPEVAGTPYYMSPEQRQGEPHSTASDIYALGLLAYELILGHLSLGRVFISLVPERISKILSKALQPSPQARYRSIREFIQDLQHYRMSGDMDKDLRVKDQTTAFYEQLQEQRYWLASKTLEFPNFISGRVYHQGYPLYPHAYYDTLLEEDVFNLWLGYSPTSNVTVALSVIKSLVSQQDIRRPLLDRICEINEFLIRMEVPMDEAGISILCLDISKENKELSWIACGKTVFWIKRQGSVCRDFVSFSPGLGKISSLQIRETKVAWEIGDEAVVSTLQLDESFASFKTLSLAELQDRRQKAIFCPIESICDGIPGCANGSAYPSTLISLKRIR